MIKRVERKLAETICNVYIQDFKETPDIIYLLDALVTKEQSTIESVLVNLPDYSVHDAYTEWSAYNLSIEMWDMYKNMHLFITKECTRTTCDE